jgi:O-antigen/teichoic acid export membrane protein
MSTPATEIPVGRIASLRRRYEPTLRESDTAKAAGLALAMIANNLIALGSTVVFARLLSDYASLAALVSYFLILSVAGQAIQVATAREGVLGHLGVGASLIATLKRWTRSMVWFTLALTVVSILLRDPIAQAVGVKNDQWAAAVGVPAGCLWLELSMLRGALQGIGDYKSVGLSLIGEQATRLVVGAALAAAGLGVTGAYLGTPISFIVMGVYCALQLRRYVERTEGATAQPGQVSRALITLWAHVKRAWAPIAGLIVIAVLQNIDIIAAKHRFNGTKDLASSYAATAVAAKVLIWVAIGAGFYLVPEVSRRRATGEDTRPVLAVALGIIAVCAVPVLLIFGFAAKPLLRIAFGENRLLASDSLFVLGVAFAVLAATYLAIQYMLALKRTWFLLAIGAVAVAEPILLLHASRRPADFAAVVLAVQAVGAVLAFAIALRRDDARQPPPSGPSGDALGDPLGGGPPTTEVGGPAQREVDRGLLVTRSGLEIASDQNAAN